MGLLLCCFDLTTVTKESKETQLLAGPNKRVTKVYSSSKASLFQRRPEPIQSMRLRPTSQKGRNNLRHGRTNVLERLDRALCNQEWRVFFQEEGRVRI